MRQKQSRLGYNINAQGIDDVGVLKKHLQALNPRAVVVMDGVGLAAEIKSMLPDCTVIHRDYVGVPGGRGDDGLHTKVGTEEFLIAQRKILADNRADNLWVYVNNEPGFNEECINWFIDLIKRNALSSQPLKLVIGNWSVGVPEAEAWQKADELLQLLDKYRELLILGMHEYFAGVAPSGFYGGNPDNAGVQPGQPGGKNLIPAENWPIATEGITLFHCGRFRFVEKRCREIGIRPPRIILTEHGADDVMKSWLSGLVKTPGYSVIRGWKSLKEQWREWYPQWSHDQAYYEMLKYLDERVYQDSSVEAQLIFTWSNNAEWAGFDVQRAVDFQRLMEAGVAKTKTQEMERQPVSKPENAGLGTRVEVRFFAPLHNLRDGPGVNYRDIGDVKSGDIFTVFWNTKRSDSNGTGWVWVEGTRDGSGWMSTLSVTFENKPTFEALNPPAPVDLPRPVEAKPERREREIRIVVTASDSEVTELTTALTQLFTVFGDMVNVWRGVLPHIEIVDKV